MAWEPYPRIRDANPTDPRGVAFFEQVPIGPVLSPSGELTLDDVCRLLHWPMMDRLRDSLEELR